VFLFYIYYLLPQPSCIFREFFKTLIQQTRPILYCRCAIMLKTTLKKIYVYFENNFLSIAYHANTVDSLRIFNIRILILTTRTKCNFLAASCKNGASEHMFRLLNKFGSGRIMLIGNLSYIAMFKSRKFMNHVLCYGHILVRMWVVVKFVTIRIVATSSSSSLFNKTD